MMKSAVWAVALSLLAVSLTNAQSGGLVNGTRGFPQANSSSGTTVNETATVSAAGQATTATTSATAVPTYITVGGAGTSGIATLAAAGSLAPCTMDANLASGAGGYYIVNSTTTNGDCHPQSAAPSAGVWVIGFLHDQSTTSGSTALVYVSGYFVALSSGGGDTITSPNGTMTVGGSSSATTLDVLKVPTTLVSASSTYYCGLFASNSTAYQAVDVASACTFNPSTGVLSATSFSGAGTGLTGTASALNIGGNAATANALAASPTNCSIGQAPTGGNASGTAQNCTAYGVAVPSCTAETSGFSATANTCYYGNASSGITATLPSVAAGAVIRIQNINSGTVTASFGSNFNCTVNGSTTSATTCAIANGSTGTVTTDGTSWYVFVAPSSSGANTALSNLAAVAINTALLTGASGIDLGSTADPFRNIYIYGSSTYGTDSIELTGTPTSTRTLTLPDATDTVVARATTDTLLNKSIAGSEINSGTVANTYGGTGQNTSSSTGVAQVSSGAWSVSNALANGTTATTQTAGNNSTDVATTAYTNTVYNLVETSGSPYTMTALTGLYWNNSTGAYSFDLPTPAAGLQLCFGNYETVAHAISLIPGSGVTIYFEGVAGTAGSGTGLVSGGAAGDYICLVGTSTTVYEAIGAGYGTWTNH